MRKDILSLINAQSKGFSKGQRQIARYLLAHYDKAAYMTAAKLGAEVSVSESTVVRFVMELGYAGYPEFQKGLQEVNRTEDLVGNVKVHCRYRFVLRCMVLEDSAWLPVFQDWVQQQSALRLIPVLGDVPAEEQVQALDGKLLERSQPGTRVCEVALVADFIKIYEEKDHGEN